MEKELKGIKITQIERNTKIQYNKELKLLKYFIEEDNNIIRFNRGRFLEANARFTHNGIINIDLENVSHKVAGDITINGIEYNIKSYKAELRAEGVTLEEKINNYIKEDASDGFLYIIEHNEKYYELEMNWEQAKEFILKFGKIDRNAIRITTCDNKIFNWIKANI